MGFFAKISLIDQNPGLSPHKNHFSQHLYRFRSRKSVICVEKQVNSYLFILMGISFLFFLAPNLTNL
tara:strand:+ start:564 stop:764 length:201 start_codon:yes stop_codon:yes gene_type:complete